LSRETKSVGTLAVLVLVGLFLIVTGFKSFTKVAAGQVCVQTRGGAGVGQLDPGYNFQVPWIEGKSCYNTYVITYEASLVSPEESQSEADYIDYAVDTKSADGVGFKLPFVVNYQIDPSQVQYIFSSVTRSDGALKEKVKDRIRAVVPAEVTKYMAADLYANGTSVEMSNAVAVTLKAELAKLGVNLVYFQLKKGDFDQYYDDAIQAKAVKVEQEKQKILEQNIAKAEATRVAIEADGAANAQIIKANADAEVISVRANAEATAVVVAANAEKEALDLRASAINENPALLQWYQIETILSANIVYLPSDVLPIMPIPGQPALTP